MYVTMRSGNASDSSDGNVGDSSEATAPDSLAIRKIINPSFTVHCCEAAMLDRLNVLNALLTYTIFNLR
jgi:hypothetical protein